MVKVTSQWSAIAITALLSAVVVNSSRFDYTKALDRKKRGLLFPESTTIGILIALAIPLENVAFGDAFVSYNFEANYNMPYLADQFIPGPLERLDLVESIESDSSRTLGTDQNTKLQNSTSIDITSNCPKQLDNNLKTIKKCTTKQKKVKKAKIHKINGGKNATDVEEGSRKKLSKQKKQIKVEHVSKRNLNLPYSPGLSIMKRPSLITRNFFYKMLEGKLDSIGHIKGRDCLLRSICQAAEEPLGHHNGVLGDLLHIILTPSSSKAEGLHKDYYKAELIGRTQDCKMYEAKCPTSVLDLITSIM